MNPPSLLAAMPIYEEVGHYVMQLLPWALAFIAIGGVAVLVMAYQEWSRVQLRLSAIRELELPASAKLVDSELAKLKARDPNFDLGAFEAKVSALFGVLMSARNALSAPPRSSVSDAVFRRSLTERALAKAHGVRRFHGNATLGEARVVGAFSDPYFDALHVRVSWTANVADVPAQASAAEALDLAAKRSEQLQTEVWVFVRRPTAKTLAGAATGKCPSCGAPYPGGEASVCTHCSAVLNSGAYDWVLTQQMDYEVYRGPWRQFTGFDDMVAHDPGFSVEAIEDRAALLFWKWIHARFERTPALAARVASPELFVELGAEAEGLREKRKRRWYFDVTVMGVDLLLLEQDSNDHHDEVCVRVRWRGKVAEFGEKTPPHVPPSSYATVLRLVRKPGVLTDVATGVSSDRCPNCRAANQEVESPVCAFCGATFSPGDRDFVLHGATAFDGWMAARQDNAGLHAAVQSFLPSFKYPDERLRLVRTMAVIAAADGAVSRSERALLKTCCRRWGIPFDQVRPLLRPDAAPPELRLKRGGTAARAFLESLCDVAAIDGKLDNRERALISKVAGHLGLEIPNRASLQARADAARRTFKASGVEL